MILVARDDDWVTSSYHCGSRQGNRESEANLSEPDQAPEYRLLVARSVPRHRRFGRPRPRRVQQSSPTARSQRHSPRLTSGSTASPATFAVRRRPGRRWRRWLPDLPGKCFRGEQAGIQQRIGESLGKGVDRDHGGHQRGQRGPGPDASANGPGKNSVWPYSWLRSRSWVEVLRRAGRTPGHLFDRPLPVPGQPGVSPQGPATPRAVAQRFPRRVVAHRAQCARPGPHRVHGAVDQPPVDRRVHLRCAPQRAPDPFPVRRHGDLHTVLDAESAPEPPGSRTRMYVRGAVMSPGREFGQDNIAETAAASSGESDEPRF